MNTPVKKCLAALALMLFLCSSAEARSAQDQKRIEEANRGRLTPTEVARHKAAKPSRSLDATIDLQYLKTLLSSETATLKDAAQVLSILIGVQDEFKEFPSQIAFLKEQGILPADIAAHPLPKTPLRKGVAAYMFCKALGIKGGITTRLFGMGPRGALKELAYQDIMSSGEVNKVLSGRELVNIFIDAAKYVLNNNE